MNGFVAYIGDADSRWFQGLVDSLPGKLFCGEGWKLRLGEGGDCHWVQTGDWLAASFGLVRFLDDYEVSSEDTLRSIVEHLAAGDESILDELSGEFTLFVAHFRSKSTYLVRDVAGLRPVFFTVDRSSVSTCIASDMRWLCNEGGVGPDKAVLASLVSAGFPIEGERTFFSGVRRFVPASVYTWVGDGWISRRYWQPPEALVVLPGDWGERVGRVTTGALLSLGWKNGGMLALSGGMDSSSLFAAMKRLQRQDKVNSSKIGTCTMSFPGMKCDETVLVEEQLRGTGFRGNFIDSRQASRLPVLDDMEGLLGWPVAGTLQHMPLLADCVANNGYRFLATGIGGDEWYNGTPYVAGDLFRRGKFLTVWRWVRRWCAVKNPGWSARVRHCVFDYVLFPPGSGFRRFYVAMFGRRVQELSGAYRQQVHRFKRNRVSGDAHLGFGRGVLMHRVRNWWTGAVAESLEPLARAKGIVLHYPMMHRECIDLAFQAPWEMALIASAPKPGLRAAFGGEIPESVLSHHTKAVFTEVGDRDADLLDPLGKASEWWLVREGIVSERVLQAELDKVAPNAMGGLLQEIALLERFCRRWFK